MLINHGFDPVEHVLIPKSSFHMKEIKPLNASLNEIKFYVKYFVGFGMFKTNITTFPLSLTSHPFFLNVFHVTNLCFDGPCLSRFSFD